MQGMPPKQLLFLRTFDLRKVDKQSLSTTNFFERTQLRDLYEPRRTRCARELRTENAETDIVRELRLMPYLYEVHPFKLLLSVG